MPTLYLTNHALKMIMFQKVKSCNQTCNYIKPTFSTLTKSLENVVCGNLLNRRKSKKGT